MLGVASRYGMAAKASSPFLTHLLHYFNGQAGGLDGRSLAGRYAEHQFYFFGWKEGGLEISYAERGALQTKA